MDAYEVFERDDFQKTGRYRQFSAKNDRKHGACCSVILKLMSIYSKYSINLRILELYIRLKDS